MLDNSKKDVDDGMIWCFKRAAGLAFIAVSLTACGHTWAELPREVRVVTFDVNHGEGMDKRIDLERTAKAISALKSDIVALQAVDKKTRRAGGIDQAAELGRLTEMKSYFCRTIDFDGGEHGIATLTNLPVRSQDAVKLKLFSAPMPEQAEQRCVQVLELGEKSGPMLLFLCTSLDYRRVNDERVASAQTINELIKKRGDTPAILAGTLFSGVNHEFSKEWKIAGLNAMGNALEAIGEGDDKRFRNLQSFPANRPKFSPSYVLFRPREKWKVVDLRVAEEKKASNKRPVLAVLRLVE
jgi:endonuclease/exonuclease/phosphatase family metal-dependent hydrolase